MADEIINIGEGLSIHPWELDMGLVRPVQFVDEKIEGLYNENCKRTQEGEIEKITLHYVPTQTLTEVDRFRPVHLVDERSDKYDNISHRKIEEDLTRKVEDHDF